MLEVFRQDECGDARGDSEMLAEGRHDLGCKKKSLIFNNEIELVATYCGLEFKFNCSFWSVFFFFDLRARRRSP
jgi:hypothetical protein